MDEVGAGADLAAENGQELDLLTLSWTGLGQGTDQHQSSHGLVTGRLWQQRIAHLLQQEDEDIKDVGSDTRRTVSLTKGDQSVQHIVMKDILQAGGHAVATRHLLLVLHHQLQHLVEVEGQLGLLYGLTLELASLLGGVVVQEHVPVMSQVLDQSEHSINIIDQSEHSITWTGGTSGATTLLSRFNIVTGQ